jgi:hypothetical protein
MNGKLTNVIRVAFLNEDRVASAAWGKRKAAREAAFASSRS